MERKFHRNYNIANSDPDGMNVDSMMDFLTNIVGLNVGDELGFNEGG